VTTTYKTVQININLTVKEHLFSEFTAVYGQKNIAFPHLSNIYTCTYIHILYTLGWARHKQLNNL